MYSKVIEFYLKKINSTASFSEVKLIDSYIDEMEEDLIIEAMNITIKNNKANTRYATRYIKAILDNWLNENITTLKQYRSKGGEQNARDESTKRSFKKGYGTKI